jgi:hypothetical protein
MAWLAALANDFAALWRRPFLSCVANLRRVRMVCHSSSVIPGCGGCGRGRTKAPLVAFLGCFPFGGMVEARSIGGLAAKATKMVGGWEKWALKPGRE